MGPLTKSRTRPFDASPTLKMTYVITLNYYYIVVRMKNGKRVGNYFFFDMAGRRDSQCKIRLRCEPHGLCTTSGPLRYFMCIYIVYILGSFWVQIKLFTIVVLF